MSWPLIDLTTTCFNTILSNFGTPQVAVLSKNGALNSCKTMGSLKWHFLVIINSKRSRCTQTQFSQNYLESMVHCILIPPADKAVYSIRNLIDRKMGQRKLDMKFIHQTAECLMPGSRTISSNIIMRRYGPFNYYVLAVYVYDIHKTHLIFTIRYVRY